MITIDGLTKAQTKLLDTMWSIDDYDDYLKWKSELSESKQLEVELLEEMLMLADIDDIEDVSQARNILAKF
jgi:hypothetical protein